MSFNEILEEVEKLDEIEAEMLINIVKRRLNEQKRSKLEEDVFESKNEADSGLLKSGILEDLMKELASE